MAEKRKASTAKKRRKSPPRKTKPFENLAAIPVTPDEIIRANNAVSASREENPNAEPGGAFEIVVFEFIADVAMYDVPDSKLGNKIRPDKVLAIIQRLKALAALADAGKIKGWQMKTSKPYELVEKSAFYATAHATLRQSGNQYFFDEDEFNKLALQFSEPEASA